MKNRFHYYEPQMNGLSIPEIEQLLAPRLRKQIDYCCSKSEYYQKKFKQAGAEPSDIRTFDDLRRLPVFMTKDDERASQEESRRRLGHTWGMHLCAPPEEVYLTGTTSGTTGVPTFTYTFTKNDIDFLAHRLGHRLNLCGVGKGDRVLFFFPLGIYATTMTLWGLRLLGALPKIGEWLPGQLTSWAGRVMHAGSASAWPALAGSVGLIVVALMGAWLVFRRQEL